jgi:hypothetical protein
MRLLFQVEAVWVACHHLAGVLACSLLLAVLVKHRESHTKWDQVLAVRGCSPNLRSLMKVSIDWENQNIGTFLSKCGCLSFFYAQNFHTRKLVLKV